MADIDEHGRSVLRTMDWSFLGYVLATHGIASDVNEVTTDEYDLDPWRPYPNVNGLRVILDRDGASKLVALLKRAPEVIDA